jgi:AraC-like DNA-binding protein
MEYSNSQIRRIIEDFIHSERDRRLLARRLIDGITIDRLSEEFELSPRQVKNILRKDEEIIFSKLP